MGRGRGRGGSRGGMNKSGMNDDEDFYDDDMGVSQLHSEQLLAFFFPLISCLLRLTLSPCSQQPVPTGPISSTQLSGGMCWC